MNSRSHLFVQAEDYKIYKSEIREHNGQVLRYLIMGGIPLSALAALTQYVMDYKDAQRLSIYLCVYFLIGLCLYDPVLSRIRNKTLLIYLVQTPVLILVTMMGTFMDPGHQAMTIFVFLSVMPILILDRPYRVCLWTVGWLVFFSVSSFCLKAEAQFKGDLMYAIEFGMASIMVSFAVINVRLSAIRAYIHALPPKVDELTGLSNIYSFFHEADMEARRLKNKDLRPCIIYIDVANLKNYNLHFGYHKGSALLAHIAATLRQNFSDRKIARFSEDHFVILSTMEEREECLSKIHEDIVNLGEEGTKIEIHTGTYELFDKIEIGNACDMARIACESIKGHANVRDGLFDMDMEIDVAKRQYVLEHLDEAIENGWIKPYFQPIVHSLTGELCHEEALARWEDPVRGLISPAEFIPPLEESGMDFKGDLYIVKCVIENILQREKDGFPKLPISVNLSRTDFLKCDMVTEISKLCDEAGVERSLICIEITESALAHHEELLKNEIMRFHKAGFKVWMDDFGSGYSALNALKEYDFDVIKFDMRFLKDLSYGSRAEIILSDLIDMAKELGIDTVAEGVETKEQFEIMRTIGCNKLQGYYFNKPNPYEYILKRFKSKSGMRFENPAITSYIENLSRINLNDPNRNSSIDRSFKTYQACAIIELKADSMLVLRGNDEYNDIIKNFDLPTETYEENELFYYIHPNEIFRTACKKSVETGLWERIERDTTEGHAAITSFVKFIAKNPLTKCPAFLVVVEKIENN